MFVLSYKTFGETFFIGIFYTNNCYLLYKRLCIWITWINLKRDTSFLYYIKKRKNFQIKSQTGHEDVEMKPHNAKNGKAILFNFIIQHCIRSH